MAVQIVLIKLINEKKETCTEHNLEAEQLKVTARRKGTALNVNHRFTYIPTFSGPIKCKQLRKAWLKAVRGESFDKKGYWKTALSDRPHKKINRF